MASLPTTPRRYAPNAVSFAKEQASSSEKRLPKTASEAQVRAAVESRLAWTALAEELEAHAWIDDRTMSDAALMLGTTAPLLAQRLRLAM